jgi:hypothetical protein
LTGSCHATGERADSYCTVSTAVTVCETVPAVAVTVTVYVPAGVGVSIVTIAVSDFVTSACATADTVTGFGLGTVAGAVYKPVVSIVPTVEFPPVTPLTCQVTDWFVLPFTTDVNRWDCVGNGLAVFGLTFTEMPPPPPPPPPPDPLPPQAGSMIADASSATSPIATIRFFRAQDLRPNPPITIPTADTHTKNGATFSRFASGRI